MSALLMVEQRAGHSAEQPWVLDRAGRRLPGHDHGERLARTREGLLRHGGVHAIEADADTASVQGVLERLHERDYLRALERVDWSEPTLMPEHAAPGMAPDTPVCADVAGAAREGVRTAVTAAQRLLAGARFTYALCRPPGHHAGPGWLGGCCLLNNAAAAAQTLGEGRLGGVGILDLDIHYPNGTAAIAAAMADTSLYSLHAWPVVNVPSQTARACCERERIVEFRRPPAEEHYLAAVAEAIEELSCSSAAIVLSLGYDTVAEDPLGDWSLSTEVFREIGRLLAASQLPVCVVQEGGYALGALPRCSHAFARGLLGEAEEAA